MNLSLATAAGPLHGTLSLPGDKSLAHRVALFSLLASGESAIANYPDSGVTRSMRRALSALGYPSVLENGVLRIEGHAAITGPYASRSAPPLRDECSPVVGCGNSGTTFRLLAGFLAATGTAATLDGSEGLRRRPMERIAYPLRLMGADVTTDSGHAPLVFRPSPLHGIDYALPVASAQVLSCLQVAALGASSPSTFRTPGPVRDHTERMLRAMGAEVASSPNGVSHVVPLSHPLRPLRGTLSGDISSAAFLLVAAAIVPGSRITLANIGLNPTRTGILDVLSAMGAKVYRTNERDMFGEPVGDIALSAAPLHGIDISGDLVVRSIDEFPAIAAAAAYADGVTTVRDAEELRYTESDRIAAIVSQLRALGVEASESRDGFSIRGGTLRGGTAHANGDHRLAMSMALCGLASPHPVTVEGAEILEESFPEFVPSLSALGIRLPA